ncbi:MAG: DUF5982 domain-containing protein [Leptospiraceae bacterium]|nr:DUF5982 domain-containing protein [Leptospiraceae bacterium]
MIKNLLGVSLLFLSISLFGQDSEMVNDPRLPFPISKKKRLSADDISKKKEGSFITGLAGPFNDPNSGFGIGGRIFWFQNGKKDDPFFEYTPYRHRVFFNPSLTNRNAHYHELNWDAPFIFNTQWRVRASIIYDRNPNNLFFGLGEESLEGLKYKPHNIQGAPTVYDGTFVEQQDNLNFTRSPRSTNEVKYLDDPYLNAALLGANPTLGNVRMTDRMYNRYQLETPQVNPSFERSFFGGVVRAVVGARLSRANIKTFDGDFYKTRDPYFQDSNYAGTDYPFPHALPAMQGRTKVTEDSEAGKIRGINGGYVNLARIGLVYDTRDFEPDPAKGIFAEVTHERSDGAWGSDYNFNRTYGSFRYFYQIFPSTFKKLVLATRVSMVNTNGSAPFFEYRNMWSTEGNLSGLGGRTTLRGFIQDRFVGPTMGFANFELRWRFFELPGFTFNIAPLLDIGRPWDSFSDVKATDKFLYSYGTGLRIIWNQSTIIYLEWARSRETKGYGNAAAPFAGTQFYLNFGHIF